MDVISGALDQIQIEEEGRLKKNTDYFFRLFEERLAETDEDKRMSDAEILQRCNEEFLASQGKKIEKQKSRMFDETGSTIDTDTYELLRNRERSLRLRYMDNYFSRYVYYRTEDWVKRFLSIFGVGK